MGDLDNRFWWAIDWWLWEHDYEGWGSLLQSIKAPKHIWQDFRFEARQWTSECVMFAIMWCITDNTWYDFKQSDIDTLRKMLPDYWWDVENWMYTSKWGDMFVDFFKKKWLTLVKNSVSTYSQDYWDISNLWRSLTFGSKVGKEYTTDIQDDGDIDYLFWWKTGHLRRIFKHKTNGNYYIVENFLWSLKRNVIEITPDKLKEQLDNKTLHYTSFYFYFLENIPVMPKHNTGTTQNEKEIVLAWEKCIQEWYKPSFINYTDEFYITRMLIDIDNHRKNR